VEGGVRGAGRAHGGHAGVHLRHRRLAVPPRAAYAVSAASLSPRSASVGSDGFAGDCIVLTPVNFGSVASF